LIEISQLQIDQLEVPPPECGFWSGTPYKSGTTHRIILPAIGLHSPIGVTLGGTDRESSIRV
jgi:hypothetical protein